MKICIKVLWVIAFCGLMMSCNHDERAPRGDIGANEMAGILLDMQIADAYNDTYIPDTDRHPENRETRIKTFYLQVLMLHHTNKEKFLKSYHFYEKHPDLMKKVYGIMEKSIGKKRAYADSATEKREQLRYPSRIQKGKQMHNFLFLYQPIIDSVFPKPKRIFKPEDYQQVHTPQMPLKAAKQS